MTNYGSKLVHLEYEGDFCGPCSFCVHNDGASKAMCMIYRTKDDHPRLLTVRQADLDYLPAYYPSLRKKETQPEALRCKECLAEHVGTGPNRKAPKGMILYPSPQQMVAGDWLDAAKIVDLSASLVGWSVQVQYGYAFEVDEEDGAEVGICALFLKARKGARGRILDLGGTEGWQGLAQLPKGAAEALMRWAGELYNDLVDVPESVTDRLWSDLHGE